MPYYEEYTESSVVPTSYVSRRNDGSIITSLEGSWVQESIHARGWRSAPHRTTLNYREIADHVMDPYASFLRSQTEREYSARLRERGLPAKAKPDRGHPWMLRKFSLHGTRVHGVHHVRPGSTTMHNTHDSVVPSTGYITLDKPNQVALRPPGFISDGLDGFSQSAYARVAPTTVIFDAAQFLGELREGLPRLGLETLRSGLKFYKGLGSDYLNVEFGWKPFLNDLINMGKALAGATSVLSGVGQRIHRRYGVPTLYEAWSADVNVFRWNNNPLTLRDDADVLNMPNHLPPNSNSEFSGLSGQASVLRTRETTRWFEGEFSNFLPLGFDPSDYFQKLSALVKLDVTPSVLWELAPWSWLIDWHIRIGDTIASNELAANDRLIMHYGYGMATVIQRDLVVIPELSGSTTPTNPPTKAGYWDPGFTRSGSWTSEYRQLRRIRANPYGFKPGGAGALTGSQFAILGALGLTKTGR